MTNGAPYQLNWCWSKAADKFAKDLAQVTERNPALAEVLRRELESGMKAATQLARSTLELTSGK